MDKSSILNGKQHRQNKDLQASELLSTHRPTGDPRFIKLTELEVRSQQGAGPGAF